MATFETRVKYSKISFSPISTEDMAAIASITLDHMRARIQAQRDWDDNPARPLKTTYAQEKVKGRAVALSTGKFKGKPVRDWFLRGRTLQSLKLKSVSENMATVGPVSAEAAKIIAARNPLDHMWAMSPSDTEALHQAVHDTLFEKVRIVTQQIPGERLVA